ncbi:PqqD family protein [Streptomyces sp. NPDC127092]|uniref:PqqD family protein n=1 Tax=Streptomyces sp. NPDC127092 TaxID=3347135 RepID=UPI003664D84B
MPAEIHGHTVPRHNLEVRIRSSEGAILLARYDQAYELPEVAAFIWRRIDGTGRVEDISRAVAEHYGIDAGTALTDTTEMLGWLLEEELIRLGS